MNARGNTRAMAAAPLAALLAAGCAYSSAVFAAGFVLGAFRIIALAPSLGEATATAIEVPFMLLLAWLVCIWLRWRFSIGAGWSFNIGMGILAFVLLLTAETLVGALAFGRALAEQALAYSTPGPALGLAAQITFASFPALQAYLERKGGW